MLLVAIVVVATTGFLSHAAYQPDLGRNALVPREKDLQLLVFGWPAGPSWLYAMTQGAHVTFGLAMVPLLLFKLWSVIPRLFAWPPPTTPAAALSKLANGLLVGSALFQLGTGLTNAQLFYPWHFNFVVAHYYGAWLFVASVALHVATQLPAMREARRTRGEILALGDTGGDPLRTPNPGPTTITRRGVLGLMGASTGAVVLGSAGQAVGGPLRDLALFAPRGAGSDDFPVNKTAKVARITQELVGASWRLELPSPSGGPPVVLSRADLLAMPQHTHALPIACVEGWSSMQTWTGVRLADLAARAGVPEAQTVHVVSVQPAGAFKQTTLGHAQIHADRGLLALQVNGADLSLDHGYPARIIVPALPGVHCTKWVGRLEFA
ncbi:MAG: molybdopterin-dependent oxidoreductase [Patulibacter minatonensis]